MKQKDITLIIVAGFLSAVLSIIFSNLFITSSSNRDQTAEVVEPVSSEFIRPPSAYFNSESINPTQLIEISPDAAGNPFDQ